MHVKICPITTVNAIIHLSLAYKFSLLVSVLRLKV